MSALFKTGYLVNDQINIPIYSEARLSINERRMKWRDSERQGRVRKNGERNWIRRGEGKRDKQRQKVCVCVCVKLSTCAHMCVCLNVCMRVYVCGVNIISYDLSPC